MVVIILSLPLSLKPIVALFLVVVIDLLISIALKQLCNKLIEIDNILLHCAFSLIQLLEEFVHMFGTELKVILNFLDPFLVHFLKIVLHQVPDLKVIQSALFIKVNFNDVCD
jgi:hypothetical protein